MRRRSGFGWMELIIGILLILLGIFTFLSPGSALTGVVIIYGVIAVIMGIADIIFYVKVEKYVGFGPSVSLISGVLSIMSGIMLLVYPNAGKWVLTLLFPIWFIAHCISRLSHLGTIRVVAGSFYYYFALIVNILGIVLGVIMILNPFISGISISLAVGAYLILTGVESVIIAFSRLGDRP